MFQIVHIKNKNPIIQLKGQRTQLILLKIPEEDNTEKEP